MDAGFLDRIRKEPDEDTHRLVYADYLDEHGNADRAEFIRLQVRLAGGVPADEASPLRRREHELLTAHEMEWTRPLHGIVQRARFVRGFVERVTLRPEDFISRGEELFRLAPVHHVIITDPGKQLRAIAACPALASVQTLEFRTLTGAKITDLLSSPHLGRLTGLILRFGELDDKGAAALAGSPRLSRLTTLDLYGSRFGTKGLRALTRSAHLAGMTTLVLNDNDSLEEEAVAALTGPELRMTKLSTLNLAFTGIGDGGAALLAREPRLAGLRVLDLKGCGIGPSTARALANSPHLQGLTLLDLRENAIAPAVRRRLVQKDGSRIKV